MTATEKALKDLDVEIVKGCIGNVKYMNENWQDFVTHWAAMDPERKKDLVDLQKLLDKCAFVSIYRFVVVGLCQAKNSISAPKGSRAVS